MAVSLKFKISALLTFSAELELELLILLLDFIDQNLFLITTIIIDVASITIFRLCRRHNIALSLVLVPEISAI